MKSGLSAKELSERDKKEPTLKQKVLELISELQPVSCRGLSMNSPFDIYRLTKPLNTLFEEGKIKVAHEGVCPITNRDVKYYALAVSSSRKGVQDV